MEKLNRIAYIAQGICWRYCIYNLTRTDVLPTLYKAFDEMYEQVQTHEEFIDAFKDLIVKDQIYPADSTNTLERLVVCMTLATVNPVRVSEQMQEETICALRYGYKLEEKSTLRFKYNQQEQTLEFSFEDFRIFVDPFDLERNAQYSISFSVNEDKSKMHYSSSLYGSLHRERNDYIGLVNDILTYVPRAPELFLKQQIAMLQSL